MPLEKRRIEPCELSRKKLEDGLRNELEATAVNTLCGIMRQLSSLSKHAEDVFGELFNEANGIYERTNSLHERVQNLAMKVTQLDSTVEEISLQEINLRKPFKSTVITDQQVLSSNTLPQAMIERYGQCDRPPRLAEMNPYRDDNKDALKFYTDPKYFFELWCEEMRKETEYKKKKKKRGGRARAGTREKKPVKVIKKKEYSSMGVEFQQTGNIRTQATSIEVSTSKEMILSEHSKPVNGDVQAGLPNHILPQQYTSGSPGSKRTSRRLTSRASSISRPSSAPPPPPPAPATKTTSQYNDDFLPPPPEEYIPQPALPPGVPAPPPPPPPPPLPGQMPKKPMPTSSDSGFSLSSEHTGQSTSVNSLTPSETSTSTTDTAPVDPRVDGRSDLLAAIRTGMELRKVQVQEAKKDEKKDDFAMDVASILARRIAVEYSSSEESETGSEWDSEGDE